MNNLKSASNLKKIGLIVLLIVIGVPVVGLLTSYLGTRLANKSSLQTFTTSRNGNSTVSVQPALEMMNDTYGDFGYAEEQAAKSMIAPAPLPPIGEDGFTPSAERTIVKNASLALQVKSVDETIAQIKAAAEARNGLLTQSNLSDSGFEGRYLSGSVVARVPSESFDSFMDQVKKLAERVTYEQVTADDRTEQRVDLEAQLRNLEATETQLLNIMSQAGDVEETLTVQRELQTVRDRIERLQAQLDNLVGAAQMATVRIELSTQLSELPVVQPDRVGLVETVKIAVRDMVSIYSELFLSGVRFVILTGPVLLVVAIAGVVWRMRKKR